MTTTGCHVNRRLSAFASAGDDIDEGQAFRRLQSAGR
jgi:hypothetical protein